MGWGCGMMFVEVEGLFFFFQAEDGIRDAQESRGLGDVYKRQHHKRYLMNLMLSFTSRLMCAPMNRIANVHDTSHPKLMDFIETGLMTCAG